MQSVEVRRKGTMDREKDIIPSTAVEGELEPDWKLAGYIWRRQQSSRDVGGAKR